MIATHTAELDLPNLPVEARTAHIFPELGNTSLLSIGQLCDAQCTATFTDTTVNIMHNNETILKGIRTKKDNLWHAKIPNTTANDNAWILVQHKNKQKAHNVNHTQKASELVAFAHGSFFSPAISTLQQALNKNYINHIPGLTAAMLLNHPPQSIAMIKGHLDQSHKNQCSTKPKVSFKPEQDTPTSPATAPTETIPAIEEQEVNVDYWPTSDPNNEKTHHCYAAYTDNPATGKIFMDQTGCFVLPASTGNTQVFILYDYDSNSIHAEPIKN